MPTENRSTNNEQMVSVPFRREDRYIVIKRSDLERLPAAQRHNFSRSCRIVHEQMFAAGAPSRSFLTIESDWPEYEPVWSMIETRVTGQPTSDGFSAGDMADQGAKAFRDGQQPITELSDDLREILGRPNFTCHHIAQALRLMGRTIAKKSEDEQASVIHWMLGHYLKHGADWRQHASDELKTASQAA
ncbi:MAG: hypothetical protein RR736_23940 [Pseudomonas sp.]|uniref:hypothetical protein n=1 Tax=Pseudomonas sp. TaxID=306 RepID=UPI002FCC5371